MRRHSLHMHMRAGRVVKAHVKRSTSNRQSLTIWTVPPTCTRQHFMHQLLEHVICTSSNLRMQLSVHPSVRDNHLTISEGQTP